MTGILLHMVEISLNHAVNVPLNSHHIIRIRQDSYFYQKWLHPKFQRCSKTLNWEKPIVKALEVIDVISTTNDDAIDRDRDRVHDHDHLHSAHHKK